MNLTAQLAQKALKKLASAEKAKVNLRFFKTGPGEYGEGDHFIGVTQPQVRSVAKQFQSLPLSETLTLLKSEIHEERMLALVIWTLKTQKASESESKKIAQTFLKNTQTINNWDLIDVATPLILGPFVYGRDQEVLKKIEEFSKSPSLWKRRIALLSTFYCIGKEDFELSLRFAQLMLLDSEDLIHKASGWMLREIGKKDLEPLRRFLQSHAHEMPRTMLRYSLEKLSEQERKKWMERKSKTKN